MFKELMQSAKLQELQHALQNKSSILIEDLWNTPKALIASLALQATGKHILILTGASQEEVRLFHDFSLFTERTIVDFPAWETLPTENVAPSPDIVGNRYQVLSDLSNADQPYIILSSLQACLQKLIPQEKFKELYLHLAVGQSYDFVALIAQLNKMGYHRYPVASDKGQFAVRGGIIDIFPVSSPDPFRLEFWENELESMRIYDPIGQKSVGPAKEISITPAQEMELLGKSAQLNTLLDYLGPNTIVIYDDLLALEDRYASLTSMAGSASKVFCSIDEFLDAVQPLQKIFWSQQPIEELTEVKIAQKNAKQGFYSETAPMQTISFQMFQQDFTANRWVAPFSTITEHLFPDISESNKMTGHEIISALNILQQKDVRLHMLCPSENDEAAFKKRLQDAGITLPKHTSYDIGYLSNGIFFNDINLMILPLAEITKRYKIRRQKQRSTYHTTPIETYDLAAGEMVVHFNNGIGRYLGIEKRPNHNGILS
ncbi:MAG: transcription-repair coupling factor, partial [Parachlamydiaceae bacterium]|nr:transcription-repair coupling factor [Parachlamydiaceae bacterium]